MTKKTKNKLIKGGAVFCALLCLMMSVMTLFASASDVVLIEQNTDSNGGTFWHFGCHYGEHEIGAYDDCPPMDKNATVKLVVNIKPKLNENALSLNISGTPQTTFHTEGVNKTYYGSYDDVFHNFIEDLWAYDITPDGYSFREWDNTWQGCEMGQRVSISGLENGDYYYLNLIEEEKPTSLVGGLFSGFGDTIDGLTGGLKSMFNNILWVDGTAESGLSHFAKFGFVMAGLSMACGLGYVIIKKIRG